MIFLIGIFKDKNLAEKCTNLAGNLLKKLGSAEPAEPTVCNSELLTSK